jgi:hypothetical protein
VLGIGACLRPIPETQVSFGAPHVGFGVTRIGLEYRIE